ncbi:MAG: OB-fold domain-containing protein [Nocardiopsaceae bacterium]|nr:OB-fold domain-containing protein [Nocardiopsaceae bacterium]
MAELTADQEPVPPLTIAGHWDFRYQYFAGDAASRFFHELGNGRIMGTLCPQCQRVLVPARGFCDACYVSTTDWRQVGDRGRLETFTILASRFPGLPDPPVVIGYVTLAGASTALLNFVLGLDLTDVEAAATRLLAQPAVEVRFRDQREGRITDFFFQLADA